MITQKIVPVSAEVVTCVRDKFIAHYAECAVEASTGCLTENQELTDYGWLTHLKACERAARLFDGTYKAAIAASCRPVTGV